MNEGDVKKGICCSLAIKRVMVNIVKNTIQTVGKNILKKMVRLEETLCMDLFHLVLSDSLTTLAATLIEISYKIKRGMPTKN